jgi:N-methylhydantoinase B
MQSAVAMAFAYLIDPDIPKNEGAFRPLTVVAKPGTVVWAHEGAR